VSLDKILVLNDSFVELGLDLASLYGVFARTRLLARPTLRDETSRDIVLELREYYYDTACAKTHVVDGNRLK